MDENIDDVTPIDKRQPMKPGIIKEGTFLEDKDKSEKTEPVLIEAWELKSVRLHQTKLFVEWLQTQESPYSFVYSEVKGMICIDKDPSIVEDVSFQNTLKRHLALLHQQGFPKIAFRVANAPRQEYGIIEFEFVKKFEAIKPRFDELRKIVKVVKEEERPIKVGGIWAMPGTPLYEKVKRKESDKEMGNE